jgi:hypothetical protein
MRTVYRLSSIGDALPLTWSFSDFTDEEEPGDGAQVLNAEQLLEALHGHNYHTGVGGGYDRVLVLDVDASDLSDGGTDYSAIDSEAEVSMVSVPLAKAKEATAKLAQLVKANRGTDPSHEKALRASLVRQGRKVSKVPWIETSKLRTAQVRSLVARYLTRVRLASEATRNTALSLLDDSPDTTFEELSKMIRHHAQYLRDPISGKEVDAEQVILELGRLMKEEEPDVEDKLPGGYITVYHATDRNTARVLLKRGAVPETKPRPRESMDYAPGRGIDVGLYVGHSVQAVNSYGSVVLSVNVPKKWIEVPTELSQLGYKDPAQALKSHDGAIIRKRIPADAFQVVLLS